MGSATPRNPALSAGRRLGAEKARAHKASRNNNGTVTSIAANKLLPEGDPPPPLTDDEIESMHSTVISLYSSMMASDEARHFRQSDWISVKIILMGVSAHLNDMAGFTIVDPITGRTRVVPAMAKVGVLTEINRALESINATPAGRTAYALSLAALAKATGAGDEDQDELDEERERNALEAADRLIAYVEQHAS